MEGKSIYEQLEQIQEQQKKQKEVQDEILEQLHRARNSEEARAEQSAPSQPSLKSYMRNSVHEHMCLGSAADFKKEKRLNVWLIIASIFAMCVCTAVTTACVGFYTTFTLFENIWLFLTLCVLKYTVKTKKFYPTLIYSFQSFEKFKYNSYGVLESAGYKRKYFWFLLLACICFVLNCAFAWTQGCTAPLLITVIEVLTLGLNLFVTYRVISFFAGYGPVRITGLDPSGVNKLSFVLDTAQNKLYTEEDYYKAFPLMRDSEG